MKRLIIYLFLLCGSATYLQGQTTADALRFSQFGIGMMWHNSESCVTAALPVKIERIRATFN